jgi:hypothetical protein
MATTHETAITHQNKTKGYARVRLNHADLTTAGLSQTLTWAALVAAHPEGASSVPPNSRVTDCWVNLGTAFSGGTVASAVIDIGDAGSADELVSAISIFTGAAAGIKPMDGSYTRGTFEAAYSPTVKVTTGTDNVVSLNAGDCEIVIEYEQISTVRYVP